MDLAAGQGLDERTQRLIGERPLVELSALQGQGLDELERVIVQLVFGGEVSVGHEGLVTNVRHEAILREAHEHLQSFQEAAQAGLAGDLLVIDLQSAWEKLGMITGETVEDDLLDQIFSKFCLGK